MRRSQRIQLALAQPTSDDPLLTIAASTGIVTIGTYLASGLTVDLTGTTYEL